MLPLESDDEEDEDEESLEWLTLGRGKGGKFKDELTDSLMIGSFRDLSDSFILLRFYTVYDVIMLYSKDSLYKGGKGGLLLSEGVTKP